MMELQLINELSESRLFRSIDKYQKYTLKDIAELSYLYILALEIFKLSDNHKDFAKKYVRDTIRFNNFHSFKFSANDLYHFFHLLVGDDNERQLKMLKDISHDVNVDFLHLRKFLRYVVNDRFDETFDRKFLFRIEKELGIKDSNLKAARRMILNWMSREDESMKKSAITKLLLILRKRIPKSEIRQELEKIAHEKLDEYKIMKIPNRWDIDTIIHIFKNPSHQELLALLKKTPGSEFRGSLDNNQNLYIWNAYDAGHDDVEQSIDFELWTDLYFALKKPHNEWWASRKINEIFVGFLHNEDFVIANSKFLRRALGVDKLDEYKIIKVDLSAYQISDPFHQGAIEPAFENIFKNPTRQEFLSLLKMHKELRGVVDLDENLYVWNAWKATHSDIIDQIVDIYSTLIFQTDLDSFLEWSDKIKNINGIYFGEAAYGIQGQGKKSIDQSKFLRRALGVDKLDEYKLIKVDMAGTSKMPQQYQTINVLKNPTYKQFINLIKKYTELRGLIDIDKNLYIWDAKLAIHSDMNWALGLEGEVYDHISFLDKQLSPATIIPVKELEFEFYSWIHSTEDHIKNSKFLKRILEPWGNEI